MSTEGENVFTKGAKTKEQVRELKAQGKSAAEIAEALGKTPATIYSHLRNIDAEGKGGEKQVKPRGRPKKVTTEAQADVKAESKPKATNGHSVEFPELRGQILKLIEQRKAEVAKLEKVLATI